MTLPSSCTKCKNALEKGFVVGYHSGYAFPDKWYPGTPVKNELFGLKVDAFKEEEAGAIAISTYRCTNCGYLESYADK